jgi:hypothetical protein
MIMIFFYTTYSNRLGLVAQLAEHWTSIPKVAGSIPIFHRGQANFSACPLWIYTQSNIKNVIFSWVHNIKTHTKKYHNYYQRRPQGLSSWRASNLVPQACDPREGTWCSGIIRCRKPGILAKTELRIPFQRPIRFLPESDYPRASRSFSRIAGSWNEIGEWAEEDPGNEFRSLKWLNYR